MCKQKFMKNNLRLLVPTVLDTLLCNIAILNSYSVPFIRNCIDQIKGFTLWIKYSAKREGLLAIIGKRSQVGSNRASILNACVTR